MQQRFKIIRLTFIILLFTIIVRLGYWQTIKADELTAMGENQRTLTRQIAALRGNILFSDGSTLATTQPAYLVYVQPKVLTAAFHNETQELDVQKDYIASQLADNLWTENREATTEAIKKDQIDSIKKTILSDLSKDLYWVSLGKRVDIDTKQRIEKLNLKGVGFDQTSIRFYPEGSSSAHLLGFVASDEYGEDKGYFGLEGYYNGELKGKDGTTVMEKDAMGLPILIGKYQNTAPRPGKTITLTIDRTVQHIVEEKLAQGMEKYQAKGASAVVMDPKTGQIIAMASLPSYDPENAFDYPNDVHKNPVTTDSYEPGSTFKVLIMAAGINEGVVTPDTICDNCSGPVKIGQYLIRTWNNQYENQLSMFDTIIHSDNTGMVFVARRLGIDKMYDYITKFGFGALTGIDLQDEDTPDLRDKKDWQEIDLATASFGQGISATPLQVVRAISAIANGGKLMEPHMVQSVIDKDKVTPIMPRVISQPITTETANTVTQMMIRAVNEGESKAFKTKGYTIAGKTGTAQIPVAGHYDPNKTIASFVGFAPANDPKFVMLVKYDEPKSSIYGAETAAPTFFDISKELFTYYGIAPTE